MRQIAALSKSVRHVLRSQQFDREFMDWLFDEADRLRELLQTTQDQRRVSKILKNKMAFIVFYEASTRTRVSFDAAAKLLGMRTVVTENAKKFSSAIKGESLEDTVRVLCVYRPDVIVMRHYEEGAAAKAASFSSVPVINAGDGAGQHPTQALLDVYTIHREKPESKRLTVVLGGDLKYGRAVRSLAYLLPKFYPRVRFLFVSPKQLRMEEDIKSHLRSVKVKFRETDSIREAFGQADVVYWTRVQKERMKGKKKLPRGMKKKFTIGRREISWLPKDAILMHPMPIIWEIKSEVDKDPRAAYFRQAENGLYVRMALLKWVVLGQ